MADGKILQSEAQAYVEQWLRQERGSVYAMFDRLDIGWTHEDVLQYMEGTPVWQALAIEGSAGKALGMALAIAALCVTHERSLRRIYAVSPETPSGGRSDDPTVR